MKESLVRRWNRARLVLQLRRAGVQLGGRVDGDPIVIANHGSIEIGDRTHLTSRPNGQPYVSSLNAWLPTARIKIGSRCILNGTAIHARDSVTVGDWCMFGPGVTLVDNDSHAVVRDRVARRTDPIVAAPIVLGNNVWMGMRCLVMKGVSIGDNTIVAAGSVVTGDLPSDIVAGGNPCRVLKELK